MANMIELIGYSWGKVHAGMIKYLCDLQFAGEIQPFSNSQAGGYGARA